MHLKSVRLYSLALLAIALGVVAFAAQPPKASKPDPTARGKYLVHNVGMCVDCHGQNLKGAMLPFKPTIEMPWAPAAPGIAGVMLSKYTDAQLMSLLTTASIKGQAPLRPPMPPYKMNAQDAKAVLQYLKSLK